MIALIFWLSFFLLAYTYFGYAIILWLISRVTRDKNKPASFEFPALTLIVPVYNEEDFIERKIQNCLSLHYPKELLTLLFVNDGSRDSTAEIIKNYPGIRLINKELRKGKSAALNTAMGQVKTDYVVFSDANTILDANSLEMLMQAYTDERIGGVSGEKKISSNSKSSVVSNAEQLYWEYESLLKKADSEFYSIVGADGGLYSIKTRLFKPLDETTILDDFFISATVCLQGYVFKYQPKAFVLETSSISLPEEKKRKVRISAGCFQALSQLKSLLNPVRDFRIFLIYLSHRVLRWVACPVLLPLLFITNMILSFYSPFRLYEILFVLQCLFYILAVAGYFLIRKQSPLKVLLVPYYFIFMNYTLYLGFGRFANHRQTVLWEKAHRA